MKKRLKNIKPDDITKIINFASNTSKFLSEVAQGMSELNDLINGKNTKHKINLENITKNYERMGNSQNKHNEKQEVKNSTSKEIKKLVENEKPNINPQQERKIIKENGRTIIIENGRIVEQIIEIKNPTVNTKTFVNNTINYNITNTKPNTNIEPNINIPNPTVNQNSEFEKNELLTGTEKYFLNELKKACQDLPINICPKVRLEDIIAAKEGINNYANRNRVKCRHIDFAIYDNRFNILLAIELDDHYHQNNKEADAFKDEIFRDSGIILERVFVKDNYTKDLQRIVAIIRSKLK